MVTWDEFVQKLKDAKKQKKNKGLSIPAITNLIFSGAFDDMVGPVAGSKYAHYLTMYEEAKKALGSKANLPPKKKDDLIALSEVKSDAQLQIWRHQINPTTSFTFVDECIKNLTHLGFERVNKGSIEATRKKVTPAGQFVNELIIVGDWTKIPEDNNHPIIRDLLNGSRTIGAIGVISNITKSSYVHDNMKKEMIKIEMFNGYGYIKDIIIWPNKKGIVDPALKALIKSGTLGVMEMKMSINKKNNRRSLSVIEWNGFMDG